MVNWSIGFLNPGVTTVIIVFICALDPIGSSAQCVKGNTILPESAAKWLLQASLTISKIEANITITMTTRVWDKGVDSMPKGVCEQAQNHPIMQFSINLTAWSFGHALVTWEVAVPLGMVITLHVLPLLVGMLLI